MGLLSSAHVRTVPAKGSGLAVIAALTVIFAATLTPASGAELRIPVLCIACGERGLADFVLNMVLFAPLGAALAARRWSVPAATALALALSASIELAQLWIPGRYTALGDVLANGSGALVGATLFGLAVSRAYLRIPAWWAAAPAVLVFVLTGWLLHRSYPHAIYYGQWTASLGGELADYDGRVLRARIGHDALPSHRVRDSRRLRTLLNSGAALDASVRVGHSPRRLAPIVSIYDQRRHEMLLVGADGSDLVVRRRDRARSWRLDQPVFRFPGALGGLEPGEVAHLSVSLAGPRLAARVDGRAYESNALTAGSGWALLYTHGLEGARTSAILDALWVGAWFGFVGLLTGAGRRDVLAALAVVVSLALVPVAVPLAATPLREWVGAAVGLGLGLLLRWWGSIRPLAPLDA